MRTQSMDTAPETERFLIRGHQAFSPAKRFAIVRGMTGGLVAANHHHFSERHPSEAAYVHHLYGTIFDEVVSAEDVPANPHAFDIYITIEALIGVLDALPIQWALTGGIAACLYGFPRTVRDIDLLVDDVALLTMHMQEHMATRFFSSSTLPTGPSFLDRETLVKVDLLQAHGTVSTTHLLSRIQHIALVDSGCPIPVLSPEDVLLTRLQWYQTTGSQADDQWNDLMGIVKIQAPHLDADYLHAQAHQCQLDGILQRLYTDTDFEGASHAADEYAGGAATRSADH